MKEDLGRGMAKRRMETVEREACLFAHWTKESTFYFLRR
jgi:hypothetical protein